MSLWSAANLTMPWTRNRKRCYNLDALVNYPDPTDEGVLAELRVIVRELRAAGRS